MKTAALALATLVSVSSAAFAGQTVNTRQTPVTTCVETSLKAKLDCDSTGSIEKNHAHAIVDNGSTSADAKEPRLGISIDPWIMPNSF